MLQQVPNEYPGIAADFRTIIGELYLPELEHCIGDKNETSGNGGSSSGLTIRIDELADRGLVRKILDNTCRMATLARGAAWELMVERHDMPQLNTFRMMIGKEPPYTVFAPFVRFSSAALPSKSVRWLRAEDIGHLMKVDGKVVSVGECRLVGTVATYFCDTCNYSLTESMDVGGGCGGGTLRRDMPCRNREGCVGDRHMMLINRASRIEHHQTVQLMDAESYSHTTTVLLRGSDHTNRLRIGDNVRLTGVLVPVGNPVGRPMRGIVGELKSLKTVMECHDFKQMDGDENYEVPDSVPVPDPQHHLYKMVRSIAPEILGCERMKLAVLLQLVACPGVAGSGNETAIATTPSRNIHVLLTDKDAVGKTSILRFVEKFHGCFYLDGALTTEAGLIGCSVKMPSGEQCLQPGLISCAHGYVMCLDNLHNMRPKRRNVLLEPMAQRAVTYTKAGHQITFPANASILAAASLDLDATDFTDALMSRFHIVVKGVADRSHLEIARHVTKRHMWWTPTTTTTTTTDDPGIMEFTYSLDELRHHVHSARKFSPTISDDVSAYIVEEYVKLRQVGREQGKFVTARAVEAIGNVAIAFAKLRRALAVTYEDVDVAVKFQLE